MPVEGDEALSILKRAFLKQHFFYFFFKLKPDHKTSSICEVAAVRKFSPGSRKKKQMNFLYFRDNLLINFI